MYILRIYNNTTPTLKVYKPLVTKVLTKKLAKYFALIETCGGGFRGNNGTKLVSGECFIYFFSGRALSYYVGTIV